MCIIILLNNRIINRTPFDSDPAIVDNNDYYPAVFPEWNFALKSVSPKPFFPDGYCFQKSKLKLTSSRKTNNVSDGWHNRFQLIIGKHHSDLYSAFGKFRKQHADAEIMLAVRSGTPQNVCSLHR